MTMNDSDSSSNEDNEYTITNVVLGYAAGEPSGDDISHVGGHPIWLDPTSTPQASFARCKVCNEHMSLLIQLNADLQQHFPTDSRRLQVWNCRRKACTRKPGSIRAIREVKKGPTSRSSKPTNTTAPQQNANLDLGNALFRGGSVSSSNNNTNPFSTGATSDSGSANPFSNLPPVASLAAKPPQRPASEQQALTESFASKLSIETAPASITITEDAWPEISKFPEPYSYFYLDAYPEELDPSPEPAQGAAAESSKIKYDIEEGSSSTVEKDTFESSLDKTFQKFSDIIAQNPEQVLRYEFKGQPLLYSGSDGVASRFIVPHGKAGAVKGIPRCEKCGSQRVFEMQLTPYLIYEVEKDDAIDIENGMEWGAIIVGTCVNNCGEEGRVAFREEWVGVQWEERVARR